MSTQGYYYENDLIHDTDACSQRLLMCESFRAWLGSQSERPCYVDENYGIVVNNPREIFGVHRAVAPINRSKHLTAIELLALPPKTRDAWLAESSKAFMEDFAHDVETWEFSALDADDFYESTE